MEKKTKVRRKWIRNPAEQVVQNKEQIDEFDSRKLKDEALSDYEELND